MYAAWETGSDNSNEDDTEDIALMAMEDYEPDSESDTEIREDQINKIGFIGIGPRYRVKLSKPILPEFSFLLDHFYVRWHLAVWKVERSADGWLLLCCMLVLVGRRRSRLCCGCLLIDWRLLLVDTDHQNSEVGTRERRSLFAFGKWELRYCKVEK
ncbi:hypothetical protein H5410_026675 [Solanum commersonii]|uniref:Uncharacterized protein n=1 Tax=Solanum commersonii TaxID=4109 RepID=A0A9J5YZQ3_SOLCO|nr:hypothetical protein H5410_026675 [Solanum commersonii]